MPATSSLSRVVQLMVKTRALRAPILQSASDNPAMIDTLCKEGVLVVVDNGRWVQFRHHLLFDYAAARLALDPNAIVSGDYRFNKVDALGLMLSPALGFVLREIWESELVNSPGFSRHSRDSFGTGPAMAAYGFWRHDHTSMHYIPG